MIGPEVPYRATMRRSSLAACSQGLAGELRQGAVSAVLTLALSLPQGLLALPVAAAQAGLARGLLILAAVGLLNVLAVAVVARAVVQAVAAGHGVPSLTLLAARRLGPWGHSLAVVGSGALFFLALVASLVGLGRSLAGFTGIPAPAAALACGLLALGLSAGRVVLSTRLLVGLGCSNMGMLVLLTLLVAPAVAPTAPVAGTGSSPLMLGVSLMLFFAPMLVPSVAQQVRPAARSGRAFVGGSALGVAAGGVLAAVWAAVVCGAARPAALAQSAGTALPALSVAVPGAAPLAAVLELCLLGMTALRCALVLRALAAEQLPWLAAGGRGLAAQLPAAIGLALALGVLACGGASFTLLIAIAGGAAASLISLVIPAMLACAGRRTP